MNLGGQETFIMNVYRNIDRDKIQFDFVVHTKEKGFYDDEIKKMGGKIYIIERISKNPLKHLKQLYNILKSNKYDVVHRHTNNAISFLDLFIAKICKVKVRIFHSHADDCSHRILNSLFKVILSFSSTVNFACSDGAGKLVFNNYFTVIPNGIDFNNFKFSPKNRMETREKCKSENNLVIGHVGRIDANKNQKFLLELIAKLDNIFCLWLIGEGEEKESLITFAKDNKIYDRVKFLGNKNDVYKYLSGMDYFIFPSKKEGLGISLIEAQVNGLPCLTSKSISKEAIISNLCFSASTSSYDFFIKKLKSNNFTRKNTILLNNAQTFDINNTVSILTKHYEGKNINE